MTEIILKPGDVIQISKKFVKLIWFQNLGDAKRWIINPFAFNSRHGNSGYLELKDDKFVIFLESQKFNLKNFLNEVSFYKCIVDDQIIWIKFQNE